jgi:hypothetical protein
MYVQHISGSRVKNTGSEEDTWTDTITAVSSLNSTSIMGENCRSTGGGTAFPRGFNTVYLLSTTTVERRRSDNGQTQTYRYSVVDWPTAFIPTLVYWNQSSLDLGAHLRTDGNLTKNATIEVRFDNTNIIVECESGNCSLIKDNWIDGSSLNKGQTKEIKFDCINQTAGIFSAVFNISSNEDSEADKITVSCEMISLTNIRWNQSALDLGTGGQNLGNLTEKVRIISQESNTNIQVSCISGNCSYILDNFSNGISMIDSNVKSADKSPSVLSIQLNSISFSSESIMLIPFE